MLLHGGFDTYQGYIRSDYALFELNILMAYTEGITA